MPSLQSRFPTKGTHGELVKDDQVGNEFSICEFQVKHVTTHRSEPRGVSESMYSPGVKSEPRSVSEAMLTYNSGVIPEPRSVPESFQPGVIVQ